MTHTEKQELISLLIQASDLVATTKTDDWTQKIILKRLSKKIFDLAQLSKRVVDTE